MTITTTDSADSGEVTRLAAEERTVIMRTDPGEATQNLGRYHVDAPSFEAIPRKVFDLDDTVTYMPETIGLAAAQPIAPWDRVLDPETQHLTLLDSMAGIDGELRPAAPGPRPGPLPPDPKPAPAPKYVGRHRRTSWFTPLVEVYAVVYARIRGAM